MKIVHIVSHTHWDREWYRTFQSFRMRLVESLDALLKIMRSTNEYHHFTLDGQTIILEDYVEIRPECRLAISKLVQEGRLHIGPWYVLPDEFLVSGEAIIRNLREGKRSSAAYGSCMSIGYLPDSFGHIGQMPQILQGFGIQTACVQRGLDDQPCEMWWEAADGSRVLLSYLRDGYGNAAHLPTDNVETFKSEALRLANALIPYTLSDHILLMQGTDHMPPQKDTGALITQISSTSEQEDQFVFLHSCLEAYFQGVRDMLSTPLGNRLPCVRGELRSSKRHHLLPGVLSTRMWIKQRNHICQTLLERWVEPLSVFARYFTSPEAHNNSPGFPEGDIGFIRYGWRTLLQCHPHDSICGCSLDQVHREMQTRFDQVEQVGDELTERYLHHLISYVNTHPPKSLNSPEEILCAIVVFNSAQITRSDWVTVALAAPLTNAGFYIIDAEGKCTEVERFDLQVQSIFNQQLSKEEFFSLVSRVNNSSVTGLPIPENNLYHLRIKRQSNDSLAVFVILSDPAQLQTQTPEIPKESLALFTDAEIQTVHLHAQKGQTKLRFLASHIPPWGYKTYWLIHSPGKSTLKPKFKRISGDWRVFNTYFEVFYHEKDNSLNILDKNNGILYANIHQFLDGGDCGDAYNFSPPEQDEVISAHLIQAHVFEHADYILVDLEYKLRIPRELSRDRSRRSLQKTSLPIHSRLTLWRHAPMIEFYTTVENKAKDHRLRVHFPTPFLTSVGYFDGHFEIVERPISLLEFDKSWVEEPRPEKPQRAFSYIRDSAGNGVILANRGLPEVEIYPTTHGTGFALTLLRCIGWLSRNDFPTRKGHAGPELPLPEAQMMGTYHFSYALIPFNKHNLYHQVHLAYAFNQPMKAMCREVHQTPGTLPYQTSFVEISHPCFVLSTIKCAEDGKGCIMRGYSIAKENIETRITPLRRFNRAFLCTLAEEDYEELGIEPDGSINITIPPGKIMTIRFYA